MRAFFFIFSFLLANCLANGQSLNYIQYGTREGLAGNVVYDMCQDKDGFLWLGTNNGLSRFDGRRFENFTVSDGLPDNEILRLFSDSYGRVWICSFKNEICYYYKGEIFNKRNDQQIAKLDLQTRINEIVEFPKGVIWLAGTDELYRFKDNNWSRVLPNDQHPNYGKVGIGFGPFWFKDRLPVVIDDSLYYFEDERLVFYRIFKQNLRNNQLFFKPNLSGDTPILFSKYDIIRATKRSENESPYLISTVNGAFEIDTVKSRLANHYLPGKTVTSGLIDFEGMYWFSTLGDGIFCLPSPNTITLKLFDSQTSGNEVFSFYKLGNKIFSGHAQSRMYIWENGERPKLVNFERYLSLSPNNLTTNRLNSIILGNHDNLLLGFDAFLVKWNNGVSQMRPFIGIKTLFLTGENDLLIATARDVQILEQENLTTKQIIWQTRATSAVKLNDSYFIGTLNGLKEVMSDGSIRDLGKIYPTLSRRISALIVHQNSLWVGTNDSGIVEFKNGRVKRSFTEKEGLNSNTIRAIYGYGDFIWVGTNKGICKITISKPRYISSKFNSINLLPNDLINALSTADGKIYVSSPSGITYFEEEQFGSRSICKLHISQIRTESGLQNPDSIIQLDYKNNHFEISYAGLSMKSAGDFQYFYRIKNLEQEWQQTNNFEITYSSLPSGNFEFQIFAENKFGVQSDIINIYIHVKTPFWKQWWFFVIITILILLLIWTIFRYRNFIVAEKIEAQNLVQKQIAELEQLALQAQMNPHFIFNSLNSIQQFILVNDSESANKFLSIFARLIRETLENSSFKRISLDREIEFLSKYLELEKMRFGDKFCFEIKHDKSLELEMIKIPVMLLQPYVENALRHGIRYRNDNRGLVQINFELVGDILICKITDNGVGRQAAEEYKKMSQIEYQSKGMNLTQRRLDILNMTEEHSIDLAINDLVDNEGHAAGTEVVLSIKIFSNNDDED